MITRFAPSPTGPLHVGHAYSALLAYDMTMAEGGKFLLRIEDIDQSRCRPKWEAQIYDDLRWLGIRWDAEPLRQSDRMPVYQTALDDLWRRGLIYPCTCTRRDIELALSAPQEGVERTCGPDGPVYPGTCAKSLWFERTFPEAYPRPADLTQRLEMSLAVAYAGFEHRIERAGGGWSSFLSFKETGSGPGHHTGLIEFTPDQIITDFGDIVLARKDIGTSYHLSVVLDDAAQNITHVVRGEDLFDATRIHVILQHLLGLPTPTYHHHRLVRDATGKRLAKRDDARAISLFRAEGATPDDIRRMVGL